MKRSADDADHALFTRSKRARLSAPIKSRYRQPGDLLLPANPQDPAVLQSLLDRTIALILHSVGFDGVKKDAFQSLRNMLDEHLVRLSGLTHLSMKSGRRNKVDPRDVDFALRHGGMRLDSLSWDLRPKAKASTREVRNITQAPLHASHRSISTALDFAFPGSLELSKHLGGASDQTGRRWIPRNLPAFPPPHTYKATSIPLSSREMDARKVRERATEEGVLAERALRKLVGARRKAGVGVESRRCSRSEVRPDTSTVIVTSDTNGKQSPDADVFQEAMDAALLEDKAKGRESLQREDEMLFLDEAAEGKPAEANIAEDRQGEEMAFGMVVNWDRGNWRTSSQGFAET